MSSLRNDQRGASHIVALIVVVLVAVVGFAGYRVMNAQKNVASNSSTNSSQKSVATPTRIQSKEDVTQASKSLDSDQIDSTLDTTSLDADLNSLL